MGSRYHFHLSASLECWDLTIVQFGKEEQGPWGHCFLKTSFSCHVSCMISRYRGQGFMLLFSPELVGPWLWQPSRNCWRRTRILLQRESTRSPRRKQAGSGTQRTAFFTHVLIPTTSHFCLKFKKIPKILNFCCKDLLQRTWVLPCFILSSATWESVCRCLLLGG